MSKRKRVGQIALEGLKLSIVKVLSYEGQTLDEIVARDDISREISSIYGSDGTNARKVVKNFLACGLDTRFKLEAGKYVASDGVDARVSVCSTTLARVSSVETAKECVVQDPLSLAQLLFGKKGRSGAHSALLQNHGKGNRYGGYEWSVVTGQAFYTPQAAHTYFTHVWVD